MPHQVVCAASLFLGGSLLLPHQGQLCQEGSLRSSLGRLDLCQLPGRHHAAVPLGQRCLCIPCLHRVLHLQIAVCLLAKCHCTRGQKC